MRVAVVVIALLALSVPVVESAVNVVPATITMFGASSAKLGIPAKMEGTLTTVVQGRVVPLVGQRVDIVDSTQAVHSTALTDSSGAYTAWMTFQTRGSWALRAVAPGPGWSAQSRVITVVVGDPPTVPQAFSVTTPTVSSASLSWSPPADDGGLPLNGYSVYRRVNNSTLTNRIVLPPTATSWTDSMPAKSDVWYYVTAHNAAGEGPKAEAFLNFRVYPDLTLSITDFWWCKEGGSCSSPLPGANVTAPSGRYHLRANMTATATLAGEPAALSMTAQADWLLVTDDGTYQQPLVWFGSSDATGTWVSTSSEIILTIAQGCVAESWWTWFDVDVHSNFRVVRDVEGFTINVPALTC